MKNVMFLTIKSGEDSNIPTLVVNNQLVEDVNQPHGWCSEHTKSGVISMVWYQEFLALWGVLDDWHSVLQASQICDKLIRYGLINMLFLNNYLIYDHERMILLKCIMSIVKVVISSENKVYDKRFSCSLKIKFPMKF